MTAPAAMAQRAAEDVEPDGGRERSRAGAGDRDHQLAGQHGRAEPCEGRQREKERRRLPEDRVVVASPLR